MQALSKPANQAMATVVRVVLLVLLALLLLSPGASPLVLIVIIPVMVWLIWRDQDRIAELEKRLAAPEKPAQPKSAEA